ncbi:S8 family serine peptidase [Longispora fulva]|uniref:Type VII secretion-associated serine protease mycosin n=1 Tax=Longispora fulva TaxID=619741 RepID=A0A8J7GLN5_9ACTN|nr:S8 family serine peptidase [Longispora fulva]MBG6138185.1 type VII secretion-associated serine protease mycosin [Longispora fulva]
MLVAAPGVAYADTVRGLSWHLDFLKVERAHAISQGEGVVVAVIDSGVDAGHPDLQGQVLPGWGIGGDAAPDGRTDNRDHGTGMASLIAGKGGNDNRLLGIAPKSKILPIALGEASEEREVSQAVRWAVDHGARVINISIAFPASELAEDLRQSVAYAMSKDVVVVAGAGNTDANGLGVGVPAAIPGVVASAAVDRSGGAWAGSSHGHEVSVGAPGVQVITSAPANRSKNGYLVGDGSSNAAALVSGEAALIRSQFKQLSAANVINRIIRTAKDAGKPGRDDLYGFGVIDPVAALTADVPEVKDNPLLGAQQGSSTGPGSAGPTGQPLVSAHIDWKIMGPLLVVVAVLAGGITWLVLASNRRRRRAVQRVPGYPPGR